MKSSYQDSMASNALIQSQATGWSPSLPKIQPSRQLLWGMLFDFIFLLLLMIYLFHTISMFFYILENNSQIIFFCQAPFSLFILLCENLFYPPPIYSFLRSTHCNPLQGMNNIAYLITGWIIYIKKWHLPLLKFFS